MKVSIVGATGYSGVELMRLLRQHPFVDKITTFATTKQESGMHTLYPHLLSNDVYPIKEINIDELIQSDIVFLATPPGVSMELTPSLLGKTKIIDLSGDYRLKDPNVYETWYQRPAAMKEHLEDAVYGLSEWMKEEIKEAYCIANPGCYATATLLGLAPLCLEDLIEEKGIIIDGKSGVSGAGKGFAPLTHYSNVNENVHIYKVNKHQHIPEIEQILKQWKGNIAPITFNTHLIPMTRGIMTTIYAQAKKEVTFQKLYDIFVHAYEGKPFVRIREPHTFPATKEVYGSNFCDIGVAYDERTGVITVVSVIDNLMKGAAGQAVQNMNIVCGFAVDSGLQQTPVFP